MKSLIHTESDRMQQTKAAVTTHVTLHFTYVVKQHCTIRFFKKCCRHMQFYVEIFLYLCSSGEESSRYIEAFSCYTHCRYFVILIADTLLYYIVDTLPHYIVDTHCRPLSKQYVIPCATKQKINLQVFMVYIYFRIIIIKVYL